MGISLTITTDTVAGGDKSWLANRKGLDTMRSVTLDLTAFSANIKASGQIPSGTALGKITATGLYGPYVRAASDGTEVATGLLFDDVRFQDADGNAFAKSVVAMFWEGIVIESKLPVFTGTDGELDANGKADLPNIRFE
jgi:hypothetical protein